MGHIHKIWNKISAGGKPVQLLLISACAFLALISICFFAVKQSAGRSSRLAQKKVEELTLEKENLRNTVKELEMKKKRLKSELETSARKVAALTSELDKAKKESARLSSGLAKKGTEIVELKDKTEKHRSEKRRTKRKFNLLNETYNVLKAQFDILTFKKVKSGEEREEDEGGRVITEENDTTSLGSIILR